MKMVTMHMKLSTVLCQIVADKKRVNECHENDQRRKGERNYMHSLRCASVQLSVHLSGMRSALQLPYRSFELLVLEIRRQRCWFD